MIQPMNECKARLIAQDLRCCSNDDCKNCSMCDDSNCSDALLVMAANAIEEILSTEDESPVRIEKVDHPSHYNREGAMECIDEMIIIYGLLETAIFCKLNAHKYRYRAGQKENGLEDLRKSDWYMNKFAELMERMNHNESSR